MKNKYLWLTPIIAAAHKVFITGFYQNEVAQGKLIPLTINTLIFSVLVFTIPFIITIVNFVKTKCFSWSLMNKMTLYALALYILLLILPEIYAKLTSKSIKQQTTEQNHHEIPWFRNAYYGFSVSTPEKMIQVKGIKMPNGYEGLYNDFEIYSFKNEASVVQLMYFDSNLEAFNLEEGLKSGIGNQLNFARGTNLNLEFVKGGLQNPSLYCNGEFLANGQRGLIKGMGYFNNGKIFNLVCYTFDDTSVSDEFLDKVIASLRIAE